MMRPRLMLVLILLFFGSGIFIAVAMLQMQLLERSSGLKERSSKMATIVRQLHARHFQTWSSLAKPSAQAGAASRWSSSAPRTADANGVEIVASSEADPVRASLHGAGRSVGSDAHGSYDRHDGDGGGGGDDAWGVDHARELAEAVQRRPIGAAWRGMENVVRGEAREKAGKLAGESAGELAGEVGADEGARGEGETLVERRWLAQRRAAASAEAVEAATPTAACTDQHTMCGVWAEAGECDNNPGYMRSTCPRACNECDFVLKKSALCHRPASKEPALLPGGINSMFESIVRQHRDRYEVEVLSQPPHGPWVVVIDDFLDDEEVNALLIKGGHHFERSLAGEGVTPVRTSQTSWCNVPVCEGDATIKRLKARVASVTGIPTTNSEHVQVLHYGIGEFYRSHHDQNASPRSPWGPRLLTFFLYLSDLEENAGGGTRFNLLNITVQPRRGRALIWPSVSDDAPSSRTDSRTQHEALPVLAGDKYAANLWLHQFDFQRPLAAGCKDSDAAECTPGECAHERAHRPTH